MPATLTTMSPHDAVAALRGRDLLSIRDLTRDELLGLIALASDIRREPARYGQTLTGKTLATLFEKPSLRTRVSFSCIAFRRIAAKRWLRT